MEGETQGKKIMYIYKEREREREREQVYGFGNIEFQQEK